MKNLKPYNGDTKKTYIEAVSRKKTQNTLNLFENEIMSAYDNYENNFKLNSLHKIATKNLSPNIRKELLEMYNYQNKIIRDIRKNITTQQIITIQNTCQNCTIDSINTMDHVLPKEKFPEFAVNGYNLFPCCGRCNGYKTDNMQPNAFLNLFLDQLPNVQYLFVEVYWDKDSINFNFNLSNKFNLISPELFLKIQNHYQNLHLLQRMKEASQNYLSSFIISNKPHYKRFGKEYIIETIKESIEEYKMAYGPNYWKCSLQLALIESNIFWKYLDIG